jgi:hypothetical protein
LASAQASGQERVFVVVYLLYCGVPITRSLM